MSTTKNVLLTEADIAAHFVDANPPLSAPNAIVESSRCYLCYDAPCIKACPTGIDIPAFIKKIFTGNLRGSATTIFSANILGGSCARVCPTEELCEQACVRNIESDQPVKIGLLQRHATDWLIDRGASPFERSAATGRHVAVVGAGPAGLACAHRLARFGHEVTIFESRQKAGGLNEYGIAAYKITEDFAQREVSFILSIGGISIRYRECLGRTISLGQLHVQFDAVFLGIGQAGVQALKVADEDIVGIRNAVDFIADVRQLPKSSVEVGRRVIVIGGGNTAVDAAVQAQMLGAEDVTIVYRRGEDDMLATGDEREWARLHDVRIRTWATPVRFVVMNGAVEGVVFARTRHSDGQLITSGEEFQLPADMVLKAIGQRLLHDPLDGKLTLQNGRIAVDDHWRTSVPGIYAGGDCVAGRDFTVTAVEHGKRAAEAIHGWLVTARA
jgi:dihydropyrimidine dehydrogenase (NAD+) subunit PreT